MVRANTLEHLPRTDPGMCADGREPGTDFHNDTEAVSLVHTDAHYVTPASPSPGAGLNLACPLLIKDLLPPTIAMVLDFHFLLMGLGL